MPKWLAQGGAVVLQAQQLQHAASTGDPHDLARALVGHLACHHLQRAAALATTAPSDSVPTPPRPHSRAASPRASAPGAAQASSSPFGAAEPASSSQPQQLPAGVGPLAAASHGHGHSTSAVAAVLTYLPDITIAKPVLRVVQELGHRLGGELAALQAGYQQHPGLAPHVDMLSRHCVRLLAAQQLQLEGLLLAPELLAATQPPRGGGGGTLSRQGSAGRLRPALPTMAPKRTVGPAPAGGTPPRPAVPYAPAPAARGAQPQQHAAAAAALFASPGTAARSGPGSTESEDDEVGVQRLVAPRGTGGRPGALVPPDEPDLDSEVASVKSASTVTSGYFAAAAGGRPAGPGAARR